MLCLAVSKAVVNVDGLVMLVLWSFKEHKLSILFPVKNISEVTGDVLLSICQEL